jgi:hypothetical protein
MTTEMAKPTRVSYRVVPSELMVCPCTSPFHSDVQISLGAEVKSRLVIPWSAHNCQDPSQITTMAICTAVIRMRRRLTLCCLDGRRRITAPH